FRPRDRKRPGHPPTLDDPSRQSGVPPRSNQEASPPFAREREWQSWRLPLTPVDDSASLREELAVLRREQQRAAAPEAAVRDVIQTIARTTFALAAVLQTVIDRAVELCRADNGNIARRDGDVYRVVAFTSFAPDFERLVRERVYLPERGS